MFAFFERCTIMGDCSFNPQPKAQAEWPVTFACGSGLNDIDNAGLNK